MNMSTARAAADLSEEEIAELWRKERERIGRLSPKEIESGLALIAQHVGLRRSCSRNVAASPSLQDGRISTTLVMNARETSAREDRRREPRRQMACARGRFSARVVAASGMDATG
jgi:hypothetical protein